MAGVEIAGLVLGTFPLCIELIKLYASGVETLRDMHHHHRELRQFQRGLEMESCKFNNTLCSLFEDALTEQDSVLFFPDPKEAERRLNARLDRPGVRSVFIHAVEALHKELSELQQQFLVDKVVADKTAGRYAQVGSTEYLKVIFPSAHYMSWRR